MDIFSNEAAYNIDNYRLIAISSALSKLIQLEKHLKTERLIYQAVEIDNIDSICRNDLVIFLFFRHFHDVRSD